MNLENVAAVVTGGGSGLGRATARALAQRGARVGVFDLDEGAATAVASGIDGLAIVCDVSDAESAASAVDQVIEQFVEEHYGIKLKFKAKLEDQKGSTISPPAVDEIPPSTTAHSENGEMVVSRVLEVFDGEILR